MKRSVVFFFVIFIATNCNRYKNIIPKEDFIDMLVDIHLADAALENSKYKQYRKYDTVIYHEYIYEKYGYTKEDFDSTIAYYTRHIEETKDIYDKVIEILKQKSSVLLDSLNIIAERRQNIWEQKNFWIFPRDGSYKNLDLDIPLKGIGKYTFECNIKIYKDDQTQNPRVNLYFYKDDSVNTHGTRIYFNTVALEKDGTKQKVMVSKDLTDTTFTHIKGSIISHTTMNKPNIRYHSQIDDIALYFEPDSLLPKNNTDKVEVKRITDDSNKIDTSLLRPVLRKRFNRIEKMNN